MRDQRCPTLGHHDPRRSRFIARAFHRPVLAMRRVATKFPMCIAHDFPLYSAGVNTRRTARFRAAEDNRERS